MAKQITLPPKFPIPSNWLWIEIGKVAFMRTGFPFDSGRFSTERNNRRPLVRIRDVVRGDTLTYTDEDCPDEYIVHRNDILIGMDGDFNIAKWRSEDALLNQRVCYICSSSEALLNDYLYYYLPDPLKKINDATPSVTVKHLSTKTLAKTSIPLPPLPEQQRIVARIESLFAKLDEVKEKAQAIVDGYEDRKAAILHKAFTGELTANWREEKGITQESWESLTLNDIAEYKKGPFGSSITKAMFVPKDKNTFKVYEQGNAIRKTTNYGRYYITEQKFNELKSFAVNAGDIIISCAGTIGEVYKLPENCERGVINQALMRVRLFSNVIEDFFIYFFSEIIKSDVIDKSNGTAIKNIPPFKVMKAMNIEVPSINEQKEIVKRIDSLISKQQQVRDSAQSVLDQIDTMKKSISARAFRGQLGTNDPADEPAVELLRKVLQEQG